jgi:hypothetical protein
MSLGRSRWIERFNSLRRLMYSVGNPVCEDGDEEEEEEEVVEVGGGGPDIIVIRDQSDANGRRG